MDNWQCEQCRGVNEGRDRWCRTCGLCPGIDVPRLPAEAFAGYSTPLTASASAWTLAGPQTQAGRLGLAPFAQTTESARHSPLRRVAGVLWPPTVLAVVVFFFAVAGLSR